MSCILRNLDNPLLSGLALGLTASKDGPLAVSPQFFPCCSGNGQAWDQRRSGYHICSLKARMSRLHDLMGLYARYYPDTARLPFQVTPAWANQILQELAGVFKRDTLPGSISYSSQKAQPSLLWSKAFASIWRFGMDVRMARLTAFDPEELMRLTRTSDKPIAIFIDQIDKLWDPAILEALEYVIQQAYNAEAFLWLEFYHEPSISESENGTPNLRQTLSRRVSKLKDRHPLDHLGPDALSRLQLMTGIHHKPGTPTHA